MSNLGLSIHVVASPVWSFAGSTTTKCSIAAMIQMVPDLLKERMKSEIDGWEIYHVSLS
jgi:hypothetical protein